MKVDGLTFDQGKHQYHFKSQMVPNVTGILGPLYDWGGIHPDVLARAAEFGSHVHLACELYDLGTLDENALDPSLGEYLNGWKMFLAMCPVTFKGIELKVFSSRYIYAGTLDRAGLYLNNDCLFDIKSGVETPVAGPQTAAYSQALLEMTGLKIKRRFSVLLRPNNFKLVEHADKNDFNIFLSCLNIHNFKTKK